MKTARFSPALVIFFLVGTLAAYQAAVALHGYAVNAPVLSQLLRFNSDEAAEVTVSDPPIAEDLPSSQLDLAASEVNAPASQYWDVAGAPSPHATPTRRVPSAQLASFQREPAPASRQEPVDTQPLDAACTEAASQLDYLNGELEGKRERWDSILDSLREFGAGARFAGPLRSAEASLSRAGRALQADDCQSATAFLRTAQSSIEILDKQWAAASGYAR